MLGEVWAFPSGLQKLEFKKPGGLMWLKNLGLPTDEIEGINSIKVVSRLLDQLRSRVVVEGAKGQSHSLFLFYDFFLSAYIREKLSPMLC